MMEQGGVWYETSHEDLLDEKRDALSLGGPPPAYRIKPRGEFFVSV